MADKDVDPHQSDKDVKTNEIQGTGQAANQEENDSTVTSTDTDAIANNDDAHTEGMVEDATKGPDTQGLRSSEVPEENPPPVDQDRSDSEKTQEENLNNIHCEADGPHLKVNESATGSTSLEETTAPPAGDDEATFKSRSDSPPVHQYVGDCEETQEILNNIHCKKKIDTLIHEEAHGPRIKLNQESGDGSTVSTEETTAAPAGDEMVPDKDVVTIGPTTQAEPAPMSDVPVTDNKRRTFWIGVIGVLVVAVAALLQLALQPKPPPQKKDVHPIEIFRQEMEKVKLQFPSQREELWKRSRIHLQRHFLITQHTEPVSIILTAGVRAEGTLHCLAQSIASALSSALNASVLHLEGASKSSQDSDMVKSDIDSQLQKAFEGGKPVAVIHRFEELPPASTLIFYRYCDHENAAFKKTFLIFTVLLGEEEEIEAKIPLSEVEEMVTDHLQKKFLAHDHPTAFDKMDIDKYGGLWSRISHLILPVSTERRIQKTGKC
ncbi:torsin-1A-interacting protein 2-like isoform X2 [Periophthalmus magnuspinnatus]|uniref:torsin-1A-interacting protein 2-like isoform X2 n=1 Tax=Periophthalmus magnuspinnatus TaxID=409849 RepID=UPI002436EFB1|nr:torsin-1A-interacting protein 2-like isoform X2 [Periophthalmus magnuspinnatus]